ncbi:MAG: ATP-dependent RNA helicase HrpA [Verrucomicrobia bacterium]|nr:ATP-dependent RNA helicase HrpA [Verrucomicrobiota bacterium]
MSAPRSHPPFPFRLQFPPELPISVRAEEITAAIQANQVVILAGETGSGKTTQIPKMCLAGGRGMRGRIACTQPRRVAALSISRRVAEELGVTWGREVGCKIRFNDHTTAQTVIKFLTDGMLLAEVQSDPLLREYDTIIIDEAHERSLNIDFLLGHLRTLRHRRPELKIIITSATIDTEAFSAAFDGAPVVLVEGRVFPVEVIYAPLDEFGSDYTANDENEEKADAIAVASAKAEALHYIEGTVEAVERIVRDSPGGDVLVFLPSERDIREVGDLLEGRRLRDSEVVPLFGRLSNAEQQRVFAPAPRRKIVLATNIAETSLTIPGIRFVVDTGLARFSRYSPQARTRRLPIEEISQSSADQRKGRSGRVAEGVCIRLYSEKDFLERPRFTQPEIQRANLADVILRMNAFRLGDIEQFPFLNLPAAKSIRAGYALLEELGAIEGGPGAPRAAESSDPPGAEHPVHQLTPLGRELARLPVDPTVGRMILQARAEKALREVLIIAAGLSIQDPRERPLDKQQQADAAHRRFAHPDSDFLTLLNIWDAYHDEFETMSQAKLRRFCRDHFLSYTRMREWRDVYAQLLDVLQERDDFRLTSVFDAVGAASRRETTMPDDRSRHKAAPTISDPMAFGGPGYRAIHRSILTGLLGNIAHLDEENGGYRATHDRKVVLFPGSVLFRREEPRKKPVNSPACAEPSAGRQPSTLNSRALRVPRWIMASEIMETTRLYARTCARLDPQWALELGAHLVRVAHSEPFWNEEGGRVMVKQRTRLYGLELETRSVSYGKIDPVRATEIFIREGLVNDTITFPLDFITHNRAVRQKVEDLLTRARDSDYLNLGEAAYRFYAAQLLPVGASLDVARAAAPSSPAMRDEGVAPPGEGVSSTAELVDLVRERRASEPRFLMFEPDDLRDPDTIPHDAAAFPAALPLENRALPLNYAYKPGQADDGVTLDVGVREAEGLTAAALDWAVPGHLEAKVEHYLRALPKPLRVLLASRMPLGDTAKSLAADLLRGGPGAPRAAGGARSAPPTLVEALAAQITGGFRVAIDPAVWADKALPDHLRVRIRVLDAEGRELCASRDLAEIHAGLAAQSREASAAVAREDPPAWRAARVKWETPEHTTWAFGEFPERVLVTEQAGAPVYAFPGLRAGADGVSRRLFKTPEEAREATRRGIAALLERQLGHELGWLQRDLRAMHELGALTATLAPIEDLQAQAFESIRRWACDPERMVAASASEWSGAKTPPAHSRGYTAANFAAALEQGKADLRGLVPRFVDLLREILALRQELLVQNDPFASLSRDLATLMPPDFLRRTPYAQLMHFPRYLKAMKLRAGRWRKNPAKDAERAAQLAPYEKALQRLSAGGAVPSPRGGTVPMAVGGTGHPADSSAVEAFRWLVEEFRVSLFAQELGTAEPVSAVKLDRALAALQPGAAGARREEPPAVLPKPIVAAPVTGKKPAPIKNLGALDRLFPR